MTLPTSGSRVRIPSSAPSTPLNRVELRLPLGRGHGIGAASEGALEDGALRFTAGDEKDVVSLEGSQDRSHCSLNGENRRSLFSIFAIVCILESSRANANDRLPRASLGWVEGGDGTVEGRDGAD